MRTYTTIILAGLSRDFRKSHILSCPLLLVDRSSVCSVHTRPVTMALSALSGRGREAVLDRETLELSWTGPNLQPPGF